jgi:phosphoglycolate phosphatase
LAQLLLRSEPIGPADQPIEAVLFDKDGTLSISEPMLHALAEARVFHGHRLLSERHPELNGERFAELDDLLRRAYGLEAGGVHPAGTTAVASRSHNLISTATALAQVGLGWPEALELSEAVFAATDSLHSSSGAIPPRATEGLHGLVEQLAAAGMRCAVISNDELAGIEAFLSAQSLRHHFQVCWSAEHSPRKPEPAAVHALCAELDVSPRACALIGDANSDLRMASAAGVSVVLGYTAAWRRRPPLDPRFPQLHHWSELGVRACSGSGNSESRDRE